MLHIREKNARDAVRAPRTKRDALPCLVPHGDVFEVLLVHRWLKLEREQMIDSREAA